MKISPERKMGNFFSINNRIGNVLIWFWVPLVFAGATSAFPAEGEESIPFPELSISNIPGPDWNLTYDPDTTLNDELLEAEADTDAIRQLKQDYRAALQELAEMQTQVYAEKPHLYPIEQYRNIPRRWTESGRDELRPLMGKHEAERELRDFITWRVQRELLESDKYRLLVELVFQVLPLQFGEFQTMLISQSDERTGFQPQNPVPPWPEELDGRIAWWNQLADARIPYMEDMLKDKMEEYQVDDEFVAALKLKTAGSDLTGYSDLYIGLVTPQELVDKRFAVEKMKDKLSNAISRLNNN